MSDRLRVEQVIDGWRHFGVLGLDTTSELHITRVSPCVTRWFKGRPSWSIPGFMRTWFCVTQLRQVACCDEVNRGLGARAWICLIFLLPLILGRGQRNPGRRFRG